MPCISRRIFIIRGGAILLGENKIRKTTMPKRKRRPPAKFAEKANPPKKRKRGPPAFAEKAKLPRYASHQAKLQSDKNEAREPKTMSTIRYGFRLAWAAAPLEMERAKVKPVGGYAPDNHHQGVCFGWPNECSMTNLRASKILRACIKSRKLTLDQIKAVRKMLAYSYELRGGKQSENWSCIKGIMATIKVSQLPPKMKEVVPVNIPTPQHLKQAFTTEWTTDNAWHFVPWCLGLICAYDAYVWGCRSKEDHEKIKKSHTHQHNWTQGWQCTKYHEGRAKLTGMKKGTRPWWCWRVCMCPGNRHVRPPADYHVEIDDNCDPKCKKVAWCSTCPLACTELIWQLQYEEDEGKRMYPKWLPKSKKRRGRFGTSNINEVSKYAEAWLEHAQKVGKFDHYSGRKSLANWVSHLQVPYAESVHIHGDLHQVWGRNYQEDIPTSVYSIRNQSREPEKACKALRKFAKWCNRGLPYKQKLKQTDRYADHLLRALGKHKLANKIRMGMPSSSDDDDEESEKKEAKENVVKPESVKRFKKEKK